MDDDGDELIIEVLLGSGLALGLIALVGFGGGERLHLVALAFALLGLAVVIMLILSRRQRQPGARPPASRDADKAKSG